jgi:hypothetical protein
MKTTKIAIDGEDFVIRSVSVYRIMKMQKDAKQAQAIEDESDRGEVMVNLLLDLCQRGIVNSLEDTRPKSDRSDLRFSDTSELAEYVDLPELQVIQDAIIELSGGGAKKNEDGKDTPAVDVIADEALKN